MEVWRNTPARATHALDALNSRSNRASSSGRSLLLLLLLTARVLGLVEREVGEGESGAPAGYSRSGAARKEQKMRCSARAGCPRAQPAAAWRQRQRRGSKHLTGQLSDPGRVASACRRPRERGRATYPCWQKSNRSLAYAQWESGPRSEEECGLFGTGGRSS